MPEAFAHPGSSPDSPAVGGLTVTITHSDEDYLRSGGFGWTGTLKLVCTKEGNHEAPIVVGSWTPTAIAGVIPIAAPCDDEMQEWKIVVDPGAEDPTGAGRLTKVQSRGDAFTIHPVYIVGVEGSGYPPVRH